MNDENNFKIIFAGLDNSGKTSMIWSLENRKSQISSIKPTAGIDRSDLKALGFPIILFDLGGQDIFRNQYLKDESLFYGTDVLFFLVDMMDRNRFADSIEYLQKILNIIDSDKTSEKETPVIICLHKCDPLNIQDPDNYIHSNIQIFQRLLRRGIKRNFKMFETTIYDYSSLVAAYSAGISRILPKAELIETYFADFAKKTKSDAVVLLDRDGLVLFEYYHNEVSQNLAQICGIQFALASENLQR
ncbi:MAG: ADP-ribosylation factor-like protein, partial [Candidatus Helarchaeota archaeon]